MTFKHPRCQISLRRKNYVMDDFKYKSSASRPCHNLNNQLQFWHYTDGWPQCSQTHKDKYKISTFKIISMTPNATRFRGSNTEQDRLETNA